VTDAPTLAIDKIALLGRTFPGLAEEELREIADLTRANTYPPGYFLCTEGAHEDTSYVIADGEAIITKKISEQEGERVIRKVSWGDYVGEMAPIQNAPRAASVRTLTQCTVLEISKADLEYMLSRSPRMALNILRSTLVRMRQNDQRDIQDLQRTNKILAQLDRNKLEFIEVAAHELRTPLTVMKGYINVMKMDPAVRGNARLLEVLDGIGKGTERFTEIVNTMLDVTRVDSDKLRIAPILPDAWACPVPIWPMRMQTAQFPYALNELHKFCWGRSRRIFAPLASPLTPGSRSAACTSPARWKLRWRRCGRGDTCTRRGRRSASGPAILATRRIAS